MPRDDSSLVQLALSTEMKTASGSEEQPSEDELPVIGPQLGADVRLWPHGREWKLKTSLEVDILLSTTSLSAPLFTGLNLPYLVLSNRHNTFSYFFQSHSC